MYADISNCDTRTAIIPVSLVILHNRANSATGERKQSRPISNVSLKAMMMRFLAIELNSFAEESGRCSCPYICPYGLKHVQS